jgi:PAS domain S-box-containing protein
MNPELASRLHQTERALEHSRQRFEAVFANATVGIVVANQAGQIVSVNDLARQLFGYPANELLGLPIEVLVPPGVSAYHEALRQSFNQNPAVRAMGHNRDLHARRRDGTVFPVEISLSYFRLDEELYAVAYIIDITFKKEAERELIEQKNRIEHLNADLEKTVAERTAALLDTLAQLEQSKNELAEALTTERELGELKSRFVAMASHEFRTPLTAILTSADLVGKYAERTQQPHRQRHLDRIRASVNHLNDILEEFLAVGRLEEGRIDPRPTAVLLPALLTEALDSIDGTKKGGQRIRVELECPQPLWIDPSLFRKVLVNLIGNAVKYSAEEATVWVRANCTPDRLTLTVQDEGVGIPPDDLEHLFERFFRAKNALNVPGTGLGLHIVRRYVELMGGQIGLESTLGIGTTVSLTIPISPPA